MVPKWGVSIGWGPQMWGNDLVEAGGVTGGRTKGIEVYKIHHKGAAGRVAEERHGREAVRGGCF